MPAEKEEMNLEGQIDRTPVKARIRNINKKSSGSPIKVPEWKQAKLVQYFGRKSTKASKARESQPETKSKEVQGANSPLLGDASKPESPSQTSKGPGPLPEGKGRGWVREAQKKTQKVMDRWPFDPGSKSQGPQQGKLVKKLKGTTLAKANREKEKEVRKQAFALEKWLGTSKGDSSMACFLGKELISGTNVFV